MWERELAEAILILVLMGALSIGVLWTIFVWALLRTAGRIVGKLLIAFFSMGDD